MGSLSIDMRSSLRAHQTRLLSAVMVQAWLHFGQSPKTVRWWSVSTGSEVSNQRLVEECHLLGRGRLEYLEPSAHCVSLYGWPLNAPALHPVEEDIRRRRDIMQLNGSAHGSCPAPQGLPLRRSPGAPVDDYTCSQCEKVYIGLPLPQHRA